MTLSDRVRKAMEALEAVRAFDRKHSTLTMLPRSLSDAIDAALDPTLADDVARVEGERDAAEALLEELAPHALRDLTDEDGDCRRCGAKWKYHAEVHDPECVFVLVTAHLAARKERG